MTDDIVIEIPIPYQGEKRNRGIMVASWETGMGYLADRDRPNEPRYLREAKNWQAWIDGIDHETEPPPR